MRALGVVAWLSSSADARPLHGSIGLGGSFLLTGDQGDRTRAELEIDLEPSRYGGMIALRGFDDHHRGLLCAGFVFEAAAARPTLVIDLHADVGVDLDQRAPLLGGGIRTSLGIAGPLGVALDAGGYVVIDGLDRTRLELATSAALIARF